ncbi:ComF family protein [Streptomyces sp. NPDC085931]|uniref:ComF family protein n=1 Tax=Streptomyces sp. NPDC085931 TaxID=3365740 RepID=UPI0037D92567
MRGWWRDLTDLVLPGECEGCGAPRTVLCARCRAVLDGVAVRRVRPVPEPSGLPVVHAAAAYADEVRATLLAHKERGALALAGPLGTALAHAVRAGLREARRPGTGAAVGDRSGAGPSRSAAGTGSDGSGVWTVGAGRAGSAGGPSSAVWTGSAGSAGRPGSATRTGSAGSAATTAGVGTGAGTAPVLLVPVPSGRRAVRARGHDPARRIALAAAADLRRGGVPARVLGVLRHRRAVADQSGLNSRQRQDNLAGALTVAPGGAGLLAAGPVVLVDDVMTTGASLAEAARAVRAAGGGPGVSYAAVTGPISNAAWTEAVYGGESWESREEQNVGSRRERTSRRPGRQEMAGADGAGGVADVVCAAVVAASPDAFQINRN